jgi:hypothetical protein
MKRPIWRFAGLVLAAALPAASAYAQLEGLLGKGGRGGDLKGLTGMAGSSLTSGSMGNVAGLLQYCIGNNYLGGEGAASVKDQLMGKLPGAGQAQPTQPAQQAQPAQPTQDPGYSDGVKGLLHGSNGNTMDLSGSGLPPDITKKACDTILAQAKSFL